MKDYFGGIAFEALVSMATHKPSTTGQDFYNICKNIRANEVSISHVE